MGIRLPQEDTHELNYFNKIKSSKNDGKDESTIRIKRLNPYIAE